jgi:septum formation protein
MHDAHGTDHSHDGSSKMTPEPSPLVLASGSPRRHAILATLGLPFKVIISNAPESIDPKLAPEDQAALLAMHKARVVASQLDAGHVIGADTMVVLDGEILGKPANDADATAMLHRLSGREHQVVTGVALVNAASGSSLHRSVTSRVRVKPLRDDEIAAYVASGEPRDKAGAYAIQETGAELIEGFDGCYNNVVGLPLCYVSVMLAHAGIEVPSPGGFCRLPDGSLCNGSV